MSARPKMSRAQRAKQFVPFMPLVGYQEALRERERKVERESEPERRRWLEDGADPAPGADCGRADDA